MDDTLKSLLVFVVILAFVGTIIAVAWYSTIDLPVQQAALRAPSNADVRASLPVGF